MIAAMKNSMPTWMSSGSSILVKWNSNAARPNMIKDITQASIPIVRTARRSSSEYPRETGIHTNPDAANTPTSSESHQPFARLFIVFSKASGPKLVTCEGKRRLKLARALGCNVDKRFGRSFDAGNSLPAEIVGEIADGYAMPSAIDKRFHLLVVSVHPSEAKPPLTAQLTPSPTTDIAPQRGHTRCSEIAVTWRAASASADRLERAIRSNASSSTHLLRR